MVAHVEAMGKGGESAALKQASTRQWQLEKLSTEELRKWAAAYGVKAEDKREALLQALVRIFASSVSNNYLR